MVNRVTAQVSRRNLILTPSADGSEVADTQESELDVTVINQSERFASFQVELSIPGLDANGVQEWYRIEPEVGTKKPPGAKTPFHIEITRSPIPIYDQAIDVLLDVYSVEYPDLHITQKLALTVQAPPQPLSLVLPNKDLKAAPGDQLEILALVYNASRSTVDVRLSCLGLEPHWLISPAEQQLQVEPAYPAQARFICKIPLDVVCPTYKREFSIQALPVSTDIKGRIPKAEGTLDILPPGVIELDCEPRRQRIPSRTGSNQDRDTGATYQIKLKNDSNAPQRVRVIPCNEQDKQKYHLDFPEPITLSPGMAQSLPLVSRLRQPWLGWRKQHQFDVTVESLDLSPEHLTSRIRAVPDRQTLELEVLPRIPFWLLLTGGILLLGFLLLAWLWNPAPRHRGPVYTVRLDGNAGNVFSGSSDQQILHWQIDNTAFHDGQRLRYEKRINQNLAPSSSEPGRAVRVIRLQPKDNNVIAAGLENGTIQLWNVLGNTPKQTPFLAKTNDRVFDLAFTSDSRYLFSAHGSGRIRQWDVTSSQPLPIRQPFSDSINFSIYALAVYEPDLKNSLVVFGGQFNQLKLWDWARKAVYDIPYQPENSSVNPSGFRPIQGQHQYIDSIAISRNLLVTADNQGAIKVWDLARRDCFLTPNTSRQPAEPVNDSDKPQVKNSVNRGSCQVPIVDQWSDGHSGQAIRAVAMTQDNRNTAYLASVGDDGQVKLWILSQGRRVPAWNRGKVLAAWGSQIHSVDIRLVTSTGHLLVTSDAPHNQVKLYREPLSSYANRK